MENLHKNDEPGVLLYGVQRRTLERFCITTSDMVWPDWIR